MTHQAQVRPHHDVLNLAFYHFETMNEKDANPELEGKDLDAMSCLLALGIGLEGLVNFVGDKLVSDWKERAPHHVKLGQIVNALGWELDEEVEPYCTFKKIKDFRDSLAHPKPFKREGVAKRNEEMDALMQAEWDHYLEPYFVRHAYHQVSEFESAIYQNEDIRAGGILTSCWGWQESEA